MNFILWTALSLAINVVMFVPAFIRRTDKLTDISYAATFIFLASIGIVSGSRNIVHWILFSCVLIWALRLGGFLFIRIQHIKVDHRFDEMRNSFWKFLRFWLLQGITVAIVLSSAFLAWSSSDDMYGTLLWVGMGIFTLGLVVEAIADFQKFTFSQKPENTGKWIQSGLWSISRHPNYLGEMLVWIGIALISSEALNYPTRYLAVISPLFIISMLLFVSGIPLLEKSADKKWGTNAEYKKYKKRTATLIPFIW